MWTNQSLSFARATGDMLIMAEAILKAGLLRKESRGSHYRLDYQDRNDAEFMKHSVAKYDAATGEHTIDWQDVDASLVTPRARTYGKTDSKKSDDSKQPAAAASS